MALSPKEQTDLVAKLEEMFESAVEHPSWREWRSTIAPTCFRYCEGDQWTAAERAVLKKRHQPEITNNQVSVTINRLVGQFVKQKVRIKYQGRNDQTDGLGAAALSDIFLFIRQVNGLEFEERDLVQDGFTSGFGVLEVGVTWNDAYEPEVTITNEDCLDVFPDPMSRRYDWNEDAKFVCRVKLPHLDEALELYPKKAKELNALFNDSADATTQGETAEADALRYRNYVDQKNKRVLLIEIEWKTYEKKNVVLVANGAEPLVLDADEMTKKDWATLQASGKQYRQIDRIEETLHSAVFTKGIVFETKKLERKRFKWVPYFMYRRKNGSPYSLIWLGISMQDAINKRESKATHLLNNNRVISTKNNIEDLKKFREEMAKPDGVAEVKNLDQMKIDEHKDLGQIFYSMHVGGMKDFRSIVGVNPDALGEPSEIRSGVGVKAKVAMTELVVAPVFDNTRRTRISLAKTVLEFVRLYYTPGKVMSITDDMKKTKSVTLGEGQISSIKQGIYDVIEEDAPDITSVRQEQYALFMQYAEAIAKLPPFWQEAVLRLSDLQEKDDLINALKQGTQPPPERPKISFTADLTELTSPERGRAWTMMGQPDLGEGLEQSGIPPAEHVRIQADQQKEQFKAQADQAKAQSAAVKTQGDMAKTRLEMQAKGQEVAGKQQLMALEIEKKKIEVAIAAINAKNAAQKPKGNKSSGEERA